MDSDVLVERTLSGAMIRDGAGFVAALDRSGLRAKAAYWELIREVGKWELSIVLPDGPGKDPLANIGQLNKVFDQQVDLKRNSMMLGLAPRLPSDIQYRELKESMNCRRGVQDEPGWFGEDLYFYRAT